MNSSELDSDWLGAPEVYEVEIKASRKLSDVNMIANETSNNETLTFHGNRIVVRPEEALIVIFVLILWMGAIGLFVHRWGKIRNCEPYAPKFEAEAHRGSCHDQSNLINKRMSMSSKLAAPGMSMTMTANPSSFTKAYPIYNRSRQNSVFVSPHLMTPPQPPRKTKSAMDLHSMISEGDCELV